MKFLFALFIILFLSACAHPTPYQAGSEDAEGYRDLKIQENRYRVAFKGNSVTSRETVETYLLYRAAELTLAQGMDYFIVQEQDTDVKSTFYNTGPTMGAAYGPRRRGFPYYTMGWGSSVSESNNYEAIAYISLKKGKAPEDNPNAYDAREVQKNLEPKIQRPKPKQ
jgi:hypothetical protein